MDGGGFRLRWASLPSRVSRSSSPPWDPTSVERRPYDCSLPGLAGFDREEVAALPSESAPPPPARWGRVSQLTAGSSAWSRLPLAGVVGLPPRSISGYRKRPASQSPTTAQTRTTWNIGIRISGRFFRSCLAGSKGRWNTALFLLRKFCPFEEFLSRFFLVVQSSPLTFQGLCF